MPNYYYEVAGQQTGPVAGDQLLAHGVTASTLVWHDGLPDWTPAATLAELADFFQPVPPPLPYRAAESPAPPLPRQPAPLPPAAGQAPTAPDRHVPPPSAPAARPQFSAAASTWKWWYYVVYVLAVVLMLLLFRACGALVRHAVAATGQELPSGYDTAAARVCGTLPARLVDAPALSYYSNS